jgi:hypothetical protein
LPRPADVGRDLVGVEQLGRDLVGVEHLGGRVEVSRMTSTRTVEVKIDFHAIRSIR